MCAENSFMVRCGKPRLSESTVQGHPIGPTTSLTGNSKPLLLTASLQGLAAARHKQGYHQCLLGKLLDLFQKLPVQLFC